MRTTVNIHDGLLETAKRRAQQEGRTLGDLVEDALHQLMARPDVPAEVGPPLPVLHTGGVLPGIDPTSNASMFAAVGDKNEDFASLRMDDAP